MAFKRVKFVIDSHLENVSLVGMSVHRICESTSFSDMDSFSIELCVVEAVTNSIKHAYAGEKGNEVGVVFTLTEEDIAIDICDSGVPMDPKRLARADVNADEDEAPDIENLSDGGRGLLIMKEIMDDVAYRSEKGTNCLTLKKSLPGKGETRQKD